MTTNLLNGKIYIGVDTKENPESNGYLGSGTILNKAILKYGRSNFEKTILYKFNSINEAYELEKYLVDAEFILRSDTYNISIGGCGGDTFTNNPNKENIRAEMCKRWSGKNHPFYGKSSPMLGLKHSVDTKNKISESLKASEKFQIAVRASDRIRKISEKMINREITWSDKITGEKNGMYGKVACTTEDGDTIIINKDDPRILSGELVRANVGYKFTNEQKQKLSSSLKNSEKFQTAMQSVDRRKKISDGVKGWKNGMYGKTHTEESKKKMSFIGGANPRSKQVNICDLYGNVLFTFDTINAAAVHLNINRNTLRCYINNSKILNNKYHICFGN